MSVDKYALCSEALIMVGGNPIADFLGGSTESQVADQLYEGCVSDVISMYRWRFSSTQVQLSRLSTAPLQRWDAAYSLPSDTEVIHGVFVNDASVDFDRYEDKILCDALVTDSLFLDYTYRANEAFWPGYFAAVMRFKLAATFSIPIADDADKAAYYEGKMIRQYAQAKNIEAQGRTAVKLPVGGLRRYHNGRP